MQNLTITLIQSTLYWQDTAANLAMFEEKLWDIEEKTDLIILPEMFNTGFTMNAKEFAEPMNFTTLKWMKQMAKQKNAVITGSFIVKEKGNHFNRLIWMAPSGTYTHYDKRHLFRMAGEHQHFDAGNQRIVMELKGWKICPLICYDLRFPAWSRNSATEQYDLLLYVANWPAPRISAWDALLKARAIENIAYVAGVNRVGEDENGMAYVGHSSVYDCKGELLLLEKEDESITTTVLNAEDLINFRAKFPAHLDADTFDFRA